MQRSEDLGLYVYDEEDNETILLHRVSSDDIYRKQEGNLQLYTLYLYITHTHTSITGIVIHLLMWTFIVHYIYIFTGCFCSDSIISWRDPEYATELALSFQEPSGCSYIW